jgi:hypothetical protein
MKPTTILIHIAVAALALLPSFGPIGVFAADKRQAPLITIVPSVDNSLLINPGKGFVQYGGTNDAYTPNYIGVGYTRINWSDMEPQDNVFNWKPVDDFIADFAKYHRKIAFGVMTVSTGIGHEYVTPKWVFDEGAVPLVIPDDSTPTHTQTIPKNWDDPVFLDKMHAFVKALGQRYDGNPNVEYVDVRSFGNWGEGHIGMLGPNVVMAQPDNLQNNYFLPYFAAFPHTQLIIPWGSDYYATVYDWAVSKGAGMRRDGILSQWSKDGSECLRAYGHAPAVFEYCDSYATTKKNGYWSTSSLMNYVNHGKPSFMQWDNQIFKENTDFILTLGNKIGYHFVLQKAVVPARLHRSALFHVQFEWLNDGVAPLYKPCFVSLALLDQNDIVIQKQWLDESHPGNWAPGQPASENVGSTFTAPPGDYKLAIGLFLDKSNETPDYRLGIQGRTAAGWYVIDAHEPVVR